MKKIISIFIMFSIINLSSYAVDFDESIDASIRKEYNVENNDLPKLPSSVPTAQENYNNITEVPKYNPTGKIYTIKSGSKLNLYSKSKIADWMQKGSRVSFSAKNGITTKEGAIIPAGTIFKGTITDSHKPQISGNGGLIELKIDEIYYNGIASRIETKISLANSKKVFHSDIKGERSYWKNYSKAMKPGRKFFHSTQTCANAMMPIPVINILSIVPLICGGVVYTVNFIAAPVIAIFSKGGSLTLPAGTEFQIKIINDNKIKG